jgi:hypothetical protein
MPDERQQPGAPAHPVGAFVERLLTAIPHLRSRFEAIADECRADGLAEAAPGEFLDGLTRDLLASFRADPIAGRAPLAELATVLEAEYGADADVDSLIDSSVLALFPPRTDPDPAAVLGPKLAAAVARDRSWRARPADAELVQRLVAAVPALEPLAAEHRFGDHGDVLVHAFLGDVMRLLADDVEAGRRDAAETVLAVLDDAWGGDNDEAIAASFVEHLPWPSEPGAALTGLLGPRLRGELDRQRHREHPPAP